MLGKIIEGGVILENSYSLLHCTSSMHIYLVIGHLQQLQYNGVGSHVSQQALLMAAVFTVAQLSQLNQDL